MEDKIQPQVEKYSNIENSKKQTRLKAFNAFLLVILVLLAVALVIFTTLLTTITVDGKSMFPTLVDGDRLILLKRGYKLERGDLIVFNRQGRNNVKRIIGLEGDVIKFDKENMVWIINGEPYVEEYVEGGYSDNYFISSPSQLFDEGVTIGPGQLFVLGDNRNISDGKVSIDSHIYGALDEATIIGKVIKIY